MTVEIIEKKEKCGTCYWRDGITCHFHAPLSVPFAMVSGKTNFITVFPSTRDEDFCSNYKES
jgi:hypothetical protein